MRHKHDPHCCARRVLDRDRGILGALAGGGAPDDQRDAVGNVHGVSVRVLEAHVRDAVGARRRRVTSVTTGSCLARQCHTSNCSGPAGFGIGISIRLVSVRAAQNLQVVCSLLSGFGVWCMLG